jgi:hypothetical protein
VPKCKTCEKEIAIGTTFIREGYDADGKMVLHHIAFGEDGHPKAESCWKALGERVFTMTAARTDVAHSYVLKQP